MFRRFRRLWGLVRLLDFVFPTLVPSSLSQAVEAEALASHWENWWFIALALTWVVTFLVAMVGLMFFRRWARTVSLWSTVLGFVFYSSTGVTVTSGPAGALMEASSVLWGVILAIAFFSPLQERFVSASNDG